MEKENKGVRFETYEVTIGRFTIQGSVKNKLPYGRSQKFSEQM